MIWVIYLNSDQYEAQNGYLYLSLVYLLTYLNFDFQAAQRFLDASLGYKLYLTLVDMLILEDDQVNYYF